MFVLNDLLFLLSFLSNDKIEILLQLFKPSVYQDAEYVRLMHDENFHLKIASKYNYKVKKNPVYKFLEKGIGDNFRNIFSPKQNWKYGILVANYPIGHPKNITNFFGIKVFKSGKTEWRENITSTVNHSLYYKEETINI